ncbi:hypothetical protein [Chitinophaga eiseniae]|uniref:Uncharacterized protein n=1 Tax=Chitinophaga eiseniae TaxID=634771 RepID=A0A847S416_9BACT|nr:hypothetical protein [Chitinophaga eiseniae]NLR78040.1 hypothetical protein [Chitinophaga eiseniae]
MRRQQKPFAMAVIISNLKSCFFFEQKHLYKLPATVFRVDYPKYRINDILSKIEVDSCSQEIVPALVIDAIIKDTIIWKAEQKEKKAKYIKQPLPDRFGFI